MKQFSLGFLMCVVAAAVGFEAGRTTAPRFPIATEAASAARVEIALVHELGGPPAKLDGIDMITAPFEQVLHTIASAKPDELIDYAKRIEAIGQKPARWGAMAIFYKTLIQVDAAMAKKLILKLPKEDRMVAILEIKNAAPPQAKPHVVDIMMTYEAGELSGCSYDYLRDTLQDWSENDPVSVRQFFEAHRDRQLERYYPALVMEWAALEPDAARDWMESEIRRIREKQPDRFETEDLPGALQSSWIDGLFQYNRNAAMDYVVSQTHEDAKKLAPSLAMMLFVESPEQAKAFVSRLPLEVQAAALDNVRGFSDRVVYGDADDRTRSPEFVADWMLQFPSTVWSENIGNVITEWRYKDTDTLFAWMSNLPPETQRMVVSAYDPFLPRDIAEKEFESAMRLSDGVLRQQLLEQIMRHGDQSAAILRQSLEKAALSQEQKMYLSGLIPESQYAVASGPDEE